MLRTCGQDTEKTLAVMGEELSVKDRLHTVAGFAREIKAGIEANKKKIDEARAHTSIAPVQPSAPASAAGG